MGGRRGKTLGSGQAPSDELRLKRARELQHLLPDPESFPDGSLIAICTKHGAVCNRKDCMKRGYITVYEVSNMMLNKQRKAGLETDV